MPSSFFGKVAALAAVTLSTVSAGPVPRTLELENINLAKFFPALSDNAAIYTPITNKEKFTSLTVRWSNLETPTVNIVVVPGTENDVSEIIKFANIWNIPFLAFNSHHGAITTLGRMDWGIEIYLGQLSSVKIAADGKSVTVGGGTNSKVLVDTLWAAGKQAVTGTCECVSYLGPALGGGHGWLQGHHGLIADQFISMNVVLASGELVTIDSKSDLFYAMKGAGHNFGVVTSVTSKIFDIEHTKWAIDTIIFSGDKIEDVYKAANSDILQAGKQSADIINWSYWMNDLTLDTKNPVVVMYIIQEGVDVVESKYTQAFYDIGPLKATPQSGTYRDLAGWTGIALASPPCQDFGFNNPRFPIYTKSYNITAQRAAYDVWAAAIGGAASPYTNSILMFEDYSTGGVREIAKDTAAFAWRDDLILAAPLIIYAPGTKADDEAVATLGNRVRDIIREGTGSAELHTYLNYAYGNEGPKGWYGYDAARLSKLQALKKKYDPQGRFSFYGPVTA